MVNLSSAFRHFKPFTALVLGDFMLDTYTSGKVRRISPEAPVPVMEASSQESRPGGAGNVVLNLLALGGKVFAVGRIGADSAGDQLQKALQGADISALSIEPSYQTPVKNRLLADSQQLLRIDFETIVPIHPNLEEIVISHLERLIPQVQVVAISDYGKGFLSNRIIAAAIEYAQKMGLPVIADPKGIDFTKYRGATVLKPNSSEAYAAAKMPFFTPLDEVAGSLLSLSGVEKLLITRSEQGMSLFEPGGCRFDFPVCSKEVKDVTGAGDTVLSLLCFGFANGLDIHTSARLANIGASLSVEKLGCAQVTLPELAQRLLDQDVENKVFDESQTYALGQVLSGKKYTLLVLEKGQSMTNALFRTIRKFSDQELVIYIQDTEPNDELIHLLSSIREIKTIILQTENLKNLCDKIHPDAVYMLCKDDVVYSEQAEKVLESLLRIGSYNATA